MFCPKCKAEFREGFTRCDDCDVALIHRVEGSAPLENRPVSDDFQPSQTNESDFVTIRTVQTLYEEAQIRSFLEANNIPSLVSGEVVGRVYGLTMDGLGARRVMVSRELAETASNLLEKADRGELEIAELPE